METTEKRRFLRFMNESEIKIKIGDKTFVYAMQDLSAGGFRIDYVEGFSVGQIVDVIIDFDCGQFATQTKVIWQNKDKGIGFEFVDTELFS
ncbi:MAG TPA: PilZ domain-containing protein [Defluviitaleaceae bacterium]|nr:PilZ domain-containing protein [Defluviitaleaceae bacterium]